MIQPEPALVTPRVVWPETGDSVPIDEVFHRMEGKPPGAIEIVGDSGSGKTTALRHLAASAPRNREIVWADDADLTDVIAHISERWVVYTSQFARKFVPDSSFCLAGWGEDERIEYLLASHPDRCQSVIVRLGAASDCSAIGGRPLLWRIVLDEMAEHESICSIDAALLRRLMCVFPEGRQRHLAEEYCYALFSPQQPRAGYALQRLQKHCGAEALRLLRALRVQLLLATEYLARWLETPKGRSQLLPPRRSLAGLIAIRRGAKEFESSPVVLPLPLVQKTAERIADSQSAIAWLREILSKDDSDLHAMAAGILHATGTGWIPERRPGLCLNAAHLQRAAWPGIDLSEMQIRLANLTGSDLAHARLDRTRANYTSFRSASLTEASLVEIVAPSADFTGADLTNANLHGADFKFAELPEAMLRAANLEGVSLQSADLRGANFVSANLQQARFAEADITGTDFSSANLKGADLHGLDCRDALLDEACLAGANLGQCNLEGMRLTGVDFTSADLSHALLSGSAMEGCTLRGANLQGAGLADIQWEGIDLREADFRGAVFHMGSSRSGMVDSSIASEGTRTGFYTDDFEQQAFQSPEEIRKANLCGADLRFANVEGVDFYLVDLRGAKYDSKQLEHFRRCRAIL